MTNNLINIFDNILYDFETANGSKARVGNFSLNIYENSKLYKIEVPLGGINPSDITLNLKNNILYIKHEKIEESMDKEKGTSDDELKLIHFEYSKPVNFERSVKLIEEIDKKSVKAINNNGLLEITIKKIVDSGTRIEIK